MSKLKNFLPVLAILASGMTAQAQEGTGLSLGEEVTQEEQISREQIGDWELQCSTTGEEPRPCVMYQLLKTAEGAPVAEVTLFPVQGNDSVLAGATIIAPLETLLTAPLTIALGEAATKRYPYSYCTQVGCVARIGLTQEDVDAYKQGTSATVTIVPVRAPDQVVSVEMSLSGFTKAFDAMKPQEQE